MVIPSWLFRWPGQSKLVSKLYESGGPYTQGGILVSLACSVCSVFISSESKAALTKNMRKFCCCQSATEKDSYPNHIMVYKLSTEFVTKNEWSFWDQLLQNILLTSSLKNSWTIQIFNPQDTQIDMRMFCGNSIQCNINFFGSHHIQKIEVIENEQGCGHSTFRKDLGHDHRVSCNGWCMNNIYKLSRAVGAWIR